MKNILVIGHSSGIGEALTLKLSDKMQVIGTYYGHSNTISHTNVSSHYLNVLDDQPDLSFIPETLDGLVYCPGSIVLKPFARTNNSEFIEDYKLQVIGAVNIIRNCLPKLKKSGSASIVLFSTVAVSNGFPYHSIVSASKGAIEGLTKALAAELAPTIRVNAIAPSITDTPLASGLLNTPEKIATNTQRHPLKRIGNVNDIASMAAFLLGDDSTWITGQVIHVDGGISNLR